VMVLGSGALGVNRSRGRVFMMALTQETPEISHPPPLCEVTAKRSSV
jgi:hypothetical protein